MNKEALVVIYWNVWLMAQDGQKDDGTKLVKRIESLTKAHNPDFFGLNEVLINRQDGKSPVVTFLEQNGYYVHFAPFSPLSEKWMIGSILASKQRPQSVKEWVLGPDTQASRRGFNGFNVKLIEGKFNFSGCDIHVVVNYLGNLLPLDWGTHLMHRRNLNHFIGHLRSRNVIIGGDFNEPKYMWTWLGLSKQLKRKTGNLWRPTWRLNGKMSNLFFANYDHILYATGGNLSLQNFTVLKRQPSDHAPLLAEFTVACDD